MSNILVTGGAGFIGTNFVHYWLRSHPADNVIVFDALTYAGNRDNLSSVDGNPCFSFVHGDICDGSLVSSTLARFSIDRIVHFAAESHVDRSITGPDEFIRTNLFGTHTLLKSARNAWFCEGGWKADVRFHHVSTDEVFGSLRTGDPAFTEATSYAPNSPYSASKAGSDHLVRAYAHTYGLPITATNCSNNYGPYQFPEKLIPLMLVNALQGKRLPVYGRGENVRDWLHVEDHCRAIDLVLNTGKVGETYNVGGGNQWRNIDIVRKLCCSLERRLSRDPSLAERFPQCPASRQRSIEPLIEFVPDRLGHDWRYAIDATKLETELGFKPLESFETGIEKTLDWYLENEPWWRAVLSGRYREIEARADESSSSLKA